MIEIYQGFQTDTNIIDYADEALLEAQEEWELERVSDLYTEATILFDAYTTGSLVLEDVKIGATGKPIEQKIIKGSMNRLSNYFSKIIKFLRNLMDNFLESMGNIFKDDVEWLNANMHYITKMPQEVKDTLTLTCIPYWKNGGHDKFNDDNLPFTAKYANLNTAVSTSIDEISKIKDQSMHEENAVYRIFFEPLYKLDAENVKKGAFLYYRGGEPSSVKFNASDAVKAINIMATFVIKGNGYINMIKAGQNRVTKQIEELEKSLEAEQKKGKELGTGQENLPTMGANGKIINPPGSTKAVEDSFFYEFEGESLYSDIEGKSLYGTEFWNMLVDDYGNKIVTEKSILPNSIRRVFAKNKRENTITSKEGKETYIKAIKILDNLIKHDPLLSKFDRGTAVDIKRELKLFDNKNKKPYELYILPQKIYLGNHGTIDKNTEEAAKKLAIAATKQLGDNRFYVSTFINWDSHPKTGSDIDCIEFNLHENEYLDTDSDLIEFIGYESYHQVVVERLVTGTPVQTGNNNNNNGGNQNQSTSKPEMDPMVNQENRVINQQRQENSEKQTSVNAAIHFCKMCGTVSSVKLSVFKEISSHYTSTLKQTVKAIKEYQGIKDEETENKNYNEQQRRNKDKLAEELVADNIQKRRIRNANKGAFSRVWSNLFGS